MNLFGIRMPRSNLNAGNRRLHLRARIWMLVMHFLNWMTQIQNPLTEKLNRMTRELIWIVIFTARQNPANLNEIKMNLIVKLANLAGKSYIRPCVSHRSLRFFTSRVLYNASLIKRLSTPRTNLRHLFCSVWSRANWVAWPFIQIKLQ